VEPSGPVKACNGIALPFTFTLKAAILDIRQQHITVHNGLEDEQIHPTSNCNLQAMLNVCIRHHQEIIA
jgi:hypothetical protein